MAQQVNGLGPGDAVRRQVNGALEVLHGFLRVGSELAVHIGAGEKALLMQLLLQFGYRLAEVIQLQRALGVKGFGLRCAAYPAGVHPLTG